MEGEMVDKVYRFNQFSRDQTCAVDMKVMSQMILIPQLKLAITGIYLQLRTSTLKFLHDPNARRSKHCGLDPDDKIESSQTRT
jgi:hypothetical protein